MYKQNVTLDQETYTILIGALGAKITELQKKIDDLKSFAQQVEASNLPQEMKMFSHALSVDEGRRTQEKITETQEKIRALDQQFSQATRSGHVGQE